MKRKYAYVFTIGSTLQWSSETIDTLKNRIKAEDDQEPLRLFVDHGLPGSFLKLSTGEMVFQIA